MISGLLKVENGMIKIGNTPIHYLIHLRPHLELKFETHLIKLEPK